MRTVRAGCTVQPYREKSWEGSGGVFRIDLPDTSTSSYLGWLLEDERIGAFGRREGDEASISSSFLLLNASYLVRTIAA